ncbi:MAG: family intrarane metalloprotease [Frankiales bacterium]|nr:family intrarane metalloprotease [Frankiales bacterium]MCW2586431.1 family intrarane metalloprotease [Frankiales bacterium]
MRLRVAVLLLAFAVAVGLRVVVGGPDVARSLTAGLLFGGCLLVLSVAAGTRVPVTRRAVLVGLAGTALVCAPVGLERLLTFTPPRSADGFLTWAAVVLVVATAEEVFLRGTLYDAVEAVAGTWPAILVAAVCFALLHVPLYGWHVVPLDLAVGIVLGGLRQGTGTPAAPAVTHVLADYVGWFLR